MIRRLLRQVVQRARRLILSTMVGDCTTPRVDDTSRAYDPGWIERIRSR